MQHDNFWNTVEVYCWGKNLSYEDYIRIQSGNGPPLAPQVYKDLFDLLNRQMVVSTNNRSKQ